MKAVILMLVLAVVHLKSVLSLNQTAFIPLSVIANNETRTCLTQQQRDAILDSLRNTIGSILSNQCGAGLWTRVAYLNMSDPMQSCPPAWRDRSANGVRVCGRPTHSRSQCCSTFYPTGGHSYTRVCGQVIGYQFGSPDGFRRSRSTYYVNESYVDGISITHGSPRSHIWTLTADRREIDNGCPCEGGPSAPAFVGSNYYCESGYNGTGDPPYLLHTSDPLWDGEQCESEGSCCSTAPWFTVDLVNATTDDIEVRICSNSADIEEDTPIQLFELYIQ